MKLSLRRLVAIVALAMLACSAVSCKSRKKQSVSEPAEAIRLEGVNEPAELLIPPEKKFVPTPEQQAMVDALKDIKGGNEPSQLPAISASINKYPRVGDLYPLRAEIRCMIGDLQGAKSDVDQGLAIHKLILSDDPNHDRPELTSMHAKLPFLAGDDAAVRRDVQSLLDTYSSDISYLTDGRVKPGDHRNSSCAWSPEDMQAWVSRSHNAPNALLFQGLYYAAFAPLDDDSKVIATRDLSAAIAANQNSAQTYFYAAVGTEKAAAFNSLGYSPNEFERYDRRLIDLYSRVIQLNSNIQRAYAERADAYLQQKEYQKAIADYDQAIRLAPNDAGLWNDRGLAKQETYDKNGAIEDFSRAIELKTIKNDTTALRLSLENRGDLYVKLGNFKKALLDYNALIGAKLQSAILWMNLDFVRELYPEYAGVDDARLREKLHRMYYPNFADETFAKELDKPEGMHPSLDAGLPDAYLKRADVLIALRDFRAAGIDFQRAQRYSKHPDDDTRWRNAPGLTNLAIDLQTLDAQNRNKVTVWVRSSNQENTAIDIAPTEFRIDCPHRTVQISRASAITDPSPGSLAESVRDYFCGTH